MLHSFTRKYFAADVRLVAAQASFAPIVIGEPNPSPDDFMDSGLQGNDLRTRAEEAAYSAEADALQAKLIAEGRRAHAAWLLSSRYEGSGRWISPPIGLHISPDTT
eukprot:scaffold3730_cov149-Ochromonas_danica.AAC.1